MSIVYVISRDAFGRELIVEQLRSEVLRVSNQAIAIETCAEMKEFVKLVESKKPMTKADVVRDVSSIVLIMDYASTDELKLLITFIDDRALSGAVHYAVVSKNQAIVDALCARGERAYPNTTEGMLELGADLAAFSRWSSSRRVGELAAG